jgi:hypothetical protein
MDTAIEIARPVTPIASDSAGIATPGPMQRIENRKRWRRDAPASAVDPGD